MAGESLVVMQDDRPGVANGREIVTANSDGTARVWDCSAGGEVLRVSHESRVTSVAISWDNKNLVTASEDAL